MNEVLKKEKKILELISELYIFIIIILFPIMVDKTGFFHILECKWNYFVIISSSYISLNVLIILYYLIIKKANYLRYIKLSIVQWTAIAFLGINILSCLTSPFLKSYNLFVGVGRGEGLIVMSLYIIAFLCVSIFAKFKKRHILYFSISSIILNTIAVLQYVGFNPFNMYQEGIGTHNVSFMTTIGNIDFISAMYCILLSVSLAAFIFLNDSKKNNIIYLISIFFGFFILGIIDVTSGKVAFLSLAVLLFPYIVRNNKRLSKFIIVIATILMAYCSNIMLNPEYHYDLGGLGIYFQFNYITLLFIIVCSILIYLAYILYKTDYNIESKKIIKYFYYSIGICIFLGIVGLYFVNFKSGIMYEIHELLHGNFDDDFGTYRIFLWKRTFKLVPQFPILGSGPDSFAIRFMAKYTADIASIGPLTINDTAANVYFTILINLGIVGFISYIAFLFSQIKLGIKYMNKYSKILFIALVCYIIQDFFNLSVVIVSPVYWLLMGLHYSSIKNN